MLVQKELMFAVAELAPDVAHADGQIHTVPGALTWQQIMVWVNQ